MTLVVGRVKFAVLQWHSVTILPSLTDTDPARRTAEIVRNDEQSTRPNSQHDLRADIPDDCLVRLLADKRLKLTLCNDWFRAVVQVSYLPRSFSTNQRAFQDLSDHIHSSLQPN